jgi:hypothetical protein
MPTVSFRLSEDEQTRLAARAAEQGITLSDLIRVTLSLSGHGLHDGGEVYVETLAEYDRRLRALEASAL